MTDIIAKLQAFVAHPEVDSMKPVWSLSQEDAREILAEWELACTVAGKAIANPVSFDKIRDKIRKAARRNGVDADALK